MEWIYKYISIAAIIAGIGFLIKYLIQRKIDAYFNVKLEKHKYELNTLTEQTRYELSKRMFDFEAFASKKHNVYPELYKKMKSFVVELHFFIQTVEVEFDLTDETIYNLEEKIPLKDDRLWWYNEASKISNIHIKAADYYTDNELYMSLEIAQKSGMCLKQFNEITDYFISRTEYNNPWVKEKYRNIEAELTELKRLLHKELSYSHFETKDSP